LSCLILQVSQLYLYLPILRLKVSVLSVNILQLLTKRQRLSRCEPCQVQGMVVANHELIHLSQVDLVFCFKTSYFSPCIPKLLNKSFLGMDSKGVGDMCSLNRLLLVLFFHLYRSFLSCFINFLKTFSFMLLLLCNSLFFILHRFFTIFHRHFILPLQRSFGTFTLDFLYMGFCSSSTDFSMPFPFFLCIGVSGKYCSLRTPLGIDDLVKGLLPLISTAGGGEGKRSFFPFLYVTLVEEETSSNPSGGGGEKYLCGEGQTSSSASLTCLLISKTGALPFLFLLILSLVLVGDEGPVIYDWGVGVGSRLK
jgi:hypothetical protein